MGHKQLPTYFLATHPSPIKSIFHERLFIHTRKYFSNKAEINYQTNESRCDASCFVGIPRGTAAAKKYLTDIIRKAAGAQSYEHVETTQKLCQTKPWAHFAQHWTWIRCECAFVSANSAVSRCEKRSCRPSNAVGSLPGGHLVWLCPTLLSEERRYVTEMKLSGKYERSVRGQTTKWSRKFCAGNSNNEVMVGSKTDNAACRLSILTRDSCSRETKGTENDIHPPSEALEHPPWVSKDFYASRLWDMT